MLACGSGKKFRWLCHISGKDLHLFLHWANGILGFRYGNIKIQFFNSKIA